MKVLLYIYTYKSKGYPGDYYVLHILFYFKYTHIIHMYIQVNEDLFAIVDLVWLF